MKLIDAIRNVKRNDECDPWVNSAPAEALMTEFGVSDYWNTDELDKRLRSYTIYNWQCTDTHVGLDAIWLDGQPMGCAFRPARKENYTFAWISETAAKAVQQALIDCAPVQPLTPTIINPDEEIDDLFSVQFGGANLTDEGLYMGRPVKILIYYGRRETEPKYRREGRAYHLRVPYGHKHYEHVLVQDGTVQRYIPISEFKMPINVVMPESVP